MTKKVIVSDSSKFPALNKEIPPIVLTVTLTFTCISNVVDVLGSVHLSQDVSLLKWGNFCNHLKHMVKEKKENKQGTENKIRQKTPLRSWRLYGT